MKINWFSSLFDGVSVADAHTAATRNFARFEPRFRRFAIETVQKQESNIGFVFLWLVSTRPFWKSLVLVTKLLSGSVTELLWLLRILYGNLDYFRSDSRLSGRSYTIPAND